MASFRGFENVGQGLAGAADILAQGYKDRLELQRQAQAQQVQAQYHQQQIANEQQKLAQQYGAQEIPGAYVPLALAGPGVLQGQRVPAAAPGGNYDPAALAAAGVTMKDGKYFVSKEGADLLQKLVGGLGAQQTAGLKTRSAEDIAAEKASLTKRALDQSYLRANQPKGGIDALLDTQNAAKVKAYNEERALLEKKYGIGIGGGQPAPAQNHFQVGAIVNGMRFKGGNDEDPSSWEKVK